MKLYNVAYSGNSYKVRLLLSHIGIPCEIVEVDILKGESRTVGRKGKSSALFYPHARFANRERTGHR